MFKHFTKDNYMIKHVYTLSNVYVYPTCDLFNLITIEQSVYATSSSD